MGLKTCTMDLVRTFKSRLRLARKGLPAASAEGEALTIDRVQALKGAVMEETALTVAHRDCIEDAKAALQGHVMRRSIKSLDFEGKPILGARPPIENYIFL